MLPIEKSSEPSAIETFLSKYRDQVQVIDLSTPEGKAAHQANLEEKRRAEDKIVPLCTSTHEKVRHALFQGEICLDCNPEYRRTCGICTAPRWRCCC